MNTGPSNIVIAHNDGSNTARLKEIILDCRVEEILGLHCKDNLYAWQEKVDLSPQSSQYCDELQRELNPDLHPPFLFTGENCMPTRLPQLLFGGVDFHDGIPKWTLIESDKLTNADKVHRYKFLAAQLKTRFLHNGNCRLLYFLTPVPLKVPVISWRIGSYVTFYCKDCYRASHKQNVTAILRVRLAYEKRGGQQCFYFQLVECYFHSCTLYNNLAEEIINNTIDNSMVTLLKVRGSTFMDDIRDQAFGEWLRNLSCAHRHVSDEGPVTRIGLGSRGRNDFKDARYQWRIESASDIPQCVNFAAFTQFLTWHLWRVLKERNMVDGFTRYLPVSTVVKKPGVPHKPGQWPLKESQLPVHLYMKGCYLIWGGYSVSSKNSKVASKKKGPDQIPHSDFANTGYESTADCKLLDGLAHPCTFNAPLEDFRELYTCKGVKTFDPNYSKQENWKIAMNEILVLHADTIHGGKTYMYDGKLHPSIHACIDSTRYPRKDGSDAVRWDISPYTYMPRQFLRFLTDSQVSEAVADFTLKGLKPMLDLVLKKSEGDLSDDERSVLLELKRCADTYSTVVRAKQEKKRRTQHGTET